MLYIAKLALCFQLGLRSIGSNIIVRARDSARVWVWVWVSVTVCVRVGFSAPRAAGARSAVRGARQGCNGNNVGKQERNG